MRDLLTDPRLELPRDLFTVACMFSRQWDRMLSDALATYGDQGPQISGCGRDHFPDEVKNALRQKAQSVSFNSSLAHDARPKGMRKATMRQLATAVANRDGSGFYGPQANNGFRIRGESCKHKERTNGI